MSHAATEAKCPSFNQLPDTLPNTNGIDTSLNFTAEEVEALRRLAHEVAALAEQPIQAQRKKWWTEHNDLVSDRPVVFCDPEFGWNEIIPQDVLVCHDPLARVWEMHLRKEIFWGTKMMDDRVIENYFNVPHHYTDSQWGLQEIRVGGEDGGAYTWEVALKDYDEDFPKLRTPVIEVDEEMSARTLGLAQDIFGGILRVRRSTPWWHALAGTSDYIRLRDMDNFLMDFYDYPEYVHKVMKFMSDGWLAKIDFLEKNGYLWANHEGTYVGSGGFGWTTQLPQDGFDPNHVRAMDMWGFVESQETVGVSPDMFEEFIYQYQEPVMARFGLNCYGCCEPLDSRWHVLKNAPRLRRLSISAWADQEFMAEALGDRYVFSRKPSPTPLSFPKVNHDEIRADVRKTLDITRPHNCRVEFIMKDNHTLGNNPQNAIDWCRIAKEEIDRIWG
ncbi:MAG: hypothetical protein LIQ30_00570 [Planctomycetes bacterium]|nr:hypothetical protein [Planctomycetota bacterium]MCD7897347.1 hypothetical protein [Planctomycetaceae bacterium]